MAELHPNQIDWNAQAPVNINVDKQKNYIAPEMENLAKTMDSVAKQKAQFEDARLTATVQTTMAQSLKEIDEARSNKADYNFLGEKSLSNWQAALNKYSPDAVARFQARNPTGLENFRLDITKKILDKTHNQILDSITNDIPRLSSEVALGNMSREDAVKTLQIAAGTALRPEEVNNKIYDLQAEVDNYNVGMAVAKGDYTKARSYLTNVDKSSTIPASKRVAWLTQISNAEEQRLKEKKEALEKGTDPRTLAISEAYSQLVQAGNNDGAANFLTELKQGRVIDSFNKDGTPHYMDLSDYPTYKVLDLAKGLETRYKDQSPTYYMEQAKFTSDVTDRIEMAGADDKYTFSDINNLRQIAADPRFKELPEKTRNKIVDKVNNFDKATVDVLYPTAGYGAQSVNRYRANPLGGMNPFYRQNKSPIGVLQELNPLQGYNKENVGEVRQAMVNNLAMLKSSVAKGGSEPSRNSRAEYVMYATNSLLSLTPEQRAAAGIPYASNQKIIQSMNRTLGGMQDNGNYQSTSDRTTASEDTKSLINMINGGELPTNEEQQKNFENLVTFSNTAQVNTGYMVTDWLEQKTANEFMDWKKIHPQGHIKKVNK